MKQYQVKRYSATIIFVDTERMPDSPPGDVPAPAGPSLDDPALTVMGLLFESAAGAQDLLEGTLDRSSGLTGQLFEPLLRLTRTEGGSLRMTDLAAQCRYSPSAVTRVSDRLEALGFAARRSCPEDRRVVHLTVTDQGRAAVEASMPAHVRMIDDEILGTLDTVERAELERLMRKVRDAVHPCATAVTPGPDVVDGVGS